MVRPRFVGLALALLTLLLYLPIYRHGFVLYDDPDYLTENRIVQGGLTWNGLKWAFTTLHASNWHPITWLSHMLDCELFSLDAGAHHLVSVLFHAVNASLLFALLLRLTGGLWPSAFVAALFAWHPLHVESVAWASERKDVLSAFFFLLTLWAYATYVEKSGIWKQKANGQTGISAGTVARSGNVTRVHASRFAFHAWFYLLALLLFALGLMAKPMLVTLPFVLLLLDYWPLQRAGANGWMKLLVEKLPFFALSAASCVITFWAQRAEAVVALDPYPVSLRVANALVAYGRYLPQTLWPESLSVIYPLSRPLPSAQVAISGVALFLISLFVWWNRRKLPYLLVGWFWFLGMLVPVIGLVQVGGQAMADRYTYLPLIGIFLGIAFGGRELLNQHRISPAATFMVAGFILGLCMLGTVRQSAYWKNSESLFAHAVAVTQDNAIAHTDLGVAFEEQGRTADALREYERAVQINPKLPQAQNNIARLLEKFGKLDEALEHYRTALQLRPQVPAFHEDVGTLLLKLGQSDEAMRYYGTAAQLAPGDPRPHLLIARALLRQGKPTEALPEFREALRRDPNDLQTLTSFARVLAAHKEPSARNGVEATALAERANSITGSSDPLVLDTLAMAYAETGQFERAVETLKQALERFSTGGEQAAVESLRARLLLYESRQPYREDFSKQP